MSTHELNVVGKSLNQLYGFSYNVKITYVTAIEKEGKIVLISTKKLTLKNNIKTYIENKKKWKNGGC